MSSAVDEADFILEDFEALLATERSLHLIETEKWGQRVRCSLTGHDFAATAEEVRKYVATKKFMRAKRRREDEEVREESAGAEDSERKKKKIVASEEEIEGETEALIKPGYQSETLFCGQLPFSASKEQIEEHFRKHGAGDVSVRLLSDKSTGQSRGMAFVECKDAKQLARGLRVHHTRLLGRVVNVERTVGGGGSGEARKAKLEGLRASQGVHAQNETRMMVAEVVQQAAAVGGMLLVEDVDDRAIEALSSFPRDLARKIVTEVSEMDLGPVKNRAAWIMGTIKRFREKIANGESFDEDDGAGENDGIGRMGSNNRRGGHHSSERKPSARGGRGAQAGRGSRSTRKKGIVSGDGTDTSREPVRGWRGRGRR